MIRAQILETGGLLTLIMTGHAGYDETGRDIVCAAASMLADALAGTMQILDPRTIRQADAGHMRVQSPAGDAARCLYFHTAVGLYQLAAAYPAHVAVLACEMTPPKTSETERSTQEHDHIGQTEPAPV